jgi:hypothetical protein
MNARAQGRQSLGFALIGVVMSASTEPPLPLALLVADRVYHDRETGKWVVAGVFSNIHFPSLPKSYDLIEIFFQVTNVSQPVDLHLRIEHSEGDLLLDVGGPMKSNSPLEVIARRVVLRNMVFQKPGKYWVMLRSGEEILTQVPLYVGLIKQQAPPGAPGGQGGPPPEQPPA